MEKGLIKIKLREALDDIFSISERLEPKKINNKTGKKDYSDVQREINKIGGPSMVDVMKLALKIPDDESGTNRSLFRKKVEQIRNPDTGSYYQFDDEELAKVRAALTNRK